MHQFESWVVGKAAKFTVLGLNFHSMEISGNFRNFQKRVTRPGDSYRETQLSIVPITRRPKVPTKRRPQASKRPQPSIATTKGKFSLSVQPLTHRRCRRTKTPSYQTQRDQEKKQRASKQKSKDSDRCVPATSLVAQR